MLHDDLVWLAKSAGLFYLIGLSVVVPGLRLLAVEQEAVRAGRRHDPRTTTTGHGHKRSAIPHPATMTTGHEWNGITELNTPVPQRCGSS